MIEKKNRLDMITCLFQKKKQLFVQSHSVILRTKNRVLIFFAENWNLKVEAVFKTIQLNYKFPYWI